MKRPVEGLTYRVKHACRGGFLTINYEKANNVVIAKEVFYRATAGTCSNCTMQAIAVLISMLLSELSEAQPSKIREIGKKLSGFSCPAVRIDFEEGEAVNVTSCIDSIGQTLIAFADEHDL